jgi:hypothetical protein
MNFADTPYSALDTYQSVISSAASTYGVPDEILNALLWSESGANPSAKGAPISKLGGISAYGIGQFIPSTAAQYGVNVQDPVSSIRGAAHYLKDLYARYGNWTSAIAAYKGSATNPTALKEANHAISLATQWGYSPTGSTPAAASATLPVTADPTQSAGTSAHASTGAGASVNAGANVNSTSSASSQPWWKTALNAASFGALSGVLGPLAPAASPVLGATATTPQGQKAVTDTVGSGFTGLLDWVEKNLVVVATILLAIALGYLGVVAAIHSGGNQ